jgi:hypothetical protein
MFPAKIEMAANLSAEKLHARMAALPPMLVYVAPPTDLSPEMAEREGFEPAIRIEAKSRA